MPVIAACAADGTVSPATTAANVTIRGIAPLDPISLPLVVIRRG
jgi:hypothetical protein